MNVNECIIRQMKLDKDIKWTQTNVDEARWGYMGVDED